MNITKELSQISWQVPEPEYRADPALSYSILSRYEKDGFDKLGHLYDKIESPSLLLGSCVDALLTGGTSEFKDRFVVFDLNCTESGIRIVKTLAGMELPYKSFYQIPEPIVSDVAKKLEFWMDDKYDKKRYGKVLDTGNVADYYEALISTDKTIVSSTIYNDALHCVEALKSSPNTQGYFTADNEDSPIRRYYQLKFKTVFKNISYRCMADLLVVDYENKIIYPCDLKTTGKQEWHFEDSFLQFNYSIQARLYWRIIKDCLSKDDYFKDFELGNFRFIVVNSHSLIPLVWEFPYTKYNGSLISSRDMEYRDPFVIGKELHEYLVNEHDVPQGIDRYGLNTISCLKPMETN